MGDFEPSFSDDIDDDDDVFMEDVSPATKKRRGRPPKTNTDHPSKKQKPKRKPKTKTTEAAPGTALPVSDPVRKLEPAPKSNPNYWRIQPSKETPLLNKRAVARHTVEVLHKVLYTPISVQKLTPLGRMSDMPHRDFKFKVESADINVNWGPLQGEEVHPGKLNYATIRTKIAKYRKTLKTWRVFVWNDMDPTAEDKPFRLFTVLTRYSQLPTVAFLTASSTTQLVKIHDECQRMRREGLRKAL
jgi:hypothetical protein